MHRGGAPPWHGAARALHWKRASEHRVRAFQPLQRGL